MQQQPLQQEHTNTTTPPWELSHQQLCNMGWYAMVCYAMHHNRVCQNVAPQQSWCVMKTVGHFFMTQYLCSMKKQWTKTATTQQNQHSKLGTAREQKKAQWVVGSSNGNHQLFSNNNRQTIYPTIHKDSTGMAVLVIACRSFH